MGESNSVLRRPVVAAAASVGAGVIHAAAVGIHAEHRALIVVFAVLAVAQTGAGLAVLEKPERPVLLTGVLVNAVAVAGWVLTRTSGISFIAGLGTPERPQAADSLCALLGAVAVVGLWRALAPGGATGRGAALPVGAVLCLTMAGLTTVRVHAHSHDEVDAAAESAFVIGPNGELILKSPSTQQQIETATTLGGSVSPAGDPTVSLTTVVPGATVPAKARRNTTTTVAAATTTTDHTHDTTPAAVLAAASGWPRVWDPASSTDIFANVGGVTAEQEARARAILAATQRDLPAWADYVTAVAAGWKSISDQATGFEHLVNQSLINDGRFLDSTAPESLVYKVSNGTKTLVSAMYISPTGTPLNDPLLTEYAGPLMQWHIHNNLCFATGPAGTPVVVGITDAAGNCRFGVKQTNGSPMVHVWIAANPCGPFAAVEGVAAGLASVPDSQRLDLCKH